RRSIDWRRSGRTGWAATRISRRCARTTTCVRSSSRARRGRTSRRWRGRRMRRSSRRAGGAGSLARTRRPGGFLGGGPAPAADDRDPVVALRYATAHFDHRGEGESLLLEARDELARTGAVEPAAEAELYLGRLYWRRGEHDRALERYNRAIALLRDAPPSRTK